MAVWPVGEVGLLRTLSSIVVFIFLAFTGLIFPEPSHAWISYEHAEIGDAAYTNAVKSLQKSSKKSWRTIGALPHISNGKEMIGVVADGKLIGRFSFGQLSAIYGDYANDFDEVNNIAFGARIENLKRITRGTSSLMIPAEHSLMKNRATNNPTHFSLRAAQEYVKWHKRAIDLVKADRRELWKALHYEAIAQHSLTDLFAFGHMLQDRELTERVFNWAKRKTPNQLISTENWKAFATNIGKATGAHTNFYHNAYNWVGAMMMNSFGDEWRGFGDGKYRITDKNCAAKTPTAKRACADKITERQRRIIVRSATVSLNQLFQTALGKHVTSGYEYNALCYLPVHYWNSAGPIDLRNQLSSIYELHQRMKGLGRPMEDHGFDFSFGYIRFQKGELRGTVDYANYIARRCNLN